MGKPDEALKYYEKAISMNPENSVIKTNMERVKGRVVKTEK
jgi:hypothetical protein